jgi:hypothetical protein
MHSRQKVQAMYQSGAKHYDFTTILFRLIGLRMKAYRLKLGGPFGYTPEYFNVRPWESVEGYFKETSFETRYWGMIYILSGTAR